MQSFGSLRERAPFRLLSIRAPRQAVLRTSSWLAPSLTNRPCDLSLKKTRDASNRRLPPNRTACTRTSCVPDSLSPLSRRGGPVETKAPRDNYRGTGCFTTSEDRFGGSSFNAGLRSLLPCGLEIRTWAFSSHGAESIEPLTPLSHPSCFPSYLAFAIFIGETEDCQDHRCHRLVKADAT